MAARDERIIAVGSDPDVRDHELLPGAPLPTKELIDRETSRKRRFVQFDTISSGRIVPLSR